MTLLSDPPTDAVGATSEIDPPRPDPRGRVMAAYVVARRTATLWRGRPAEPDEIAPPGRLRRTWAVVTPVARAVLAVAGVSWLIGWRLGWYEFMVIAVAAVAVLLVALPFAFGRPLLDVTLELAPSRVTVGDRAAGRLVVRNAARGRLLPLRIELPVGRGVARFDLPSLGVGVEHDELFTVPTRRRAVITVGPVRSVRGDALGLYRREVDWSGAEELIVHPATVQLETLGSGFLRDLEGQVTNHLSSSDVAFHTLRDYVPGDDRRFVHWRTSARTGKLMVRQFVDTRRSHAAIVVDLDRDNYAPATEAGSVRGDEFELAVAAAASLAVRVIRDEQTLTLMSGHGRLPCTTGQQALDSCSRLEPDQRGALAAASGALTRDAADASIIFLFSGSQASVGTLRRAVRGVSPDARVVALRARLGGKSAFRDSAGMSILELADLTQMAGLIRTAVR